MKTAYYIIILVIIVLIAGLITSGNNKIVYLTIDDCASSNFKEKVDYLYDNNIPASFFCIGKLIEENQEDVVYAINKGYDIHNHSYSHNHFSDLNLEEITYEITKTDKLIDEIYRLAGKERKNKYIRLPYGDKLYFKPEINTSVQEIVKELNYIKPNIKRLRFNLINNLYKQDIDLYWTYMTKEYKKDSGKVIKNLKNRLKTNGNELLVIHDHDNKAFFKIIDTLKESDVKVKALS